MRTLQSVSVIGNGNGALVDLAGMLGSVDSGWYVSPNAKTVQALRAGKLVCEQRGVSDALAAALAAGRLQVTTSLLEAVLATDVTLMSTDGSEETSLDDLLLQVGSCLLHKGSYHLVVIRDTLEPGEMEARVKPLLERFSARRCSKDFGLCYAPEVVREGIALADYRNPVRMLIGTEDRASADSLSHLFRGRVGAITRGSWLETELTRQADARWHTLKRDFAAQLGAECDHFSVEFDRVQRAFSRDTKLNLSSVQIDSEAVPIPVCDNESQGPVREGLRLVAAG